MLVVPSEISIKKAIEAKSRLLKNLNFWYIVMNIADLMENEEQVQDMNGRMMRTQKKLQELKARK